MMTRAGYHPDMVKDFPHAGFTTDRVISSGRRAHGLRLRAADLIERDRGQTNLDRRMVHGAAAWALFKLADLMDWLRI